MHRNRERGAGLFWKGSHKQNLYIGSHLQGCQLFHSLSAKYGFLLKNKSFQDKRFYRLNEAIPSKKREEK